MKNATRPNFDILKHKPNNQYIQEYFSDLQELEPTTSRLIDKTHSNYLEWGMDEEYLLLAERKKNAHGYNENFITKHTLTTSEFVKKFGDKGVEILWEWYRDAMIRRKGSNGDQRTPLEFKRFAYHFFGDYSSQNSLMYGNEVDGFLLGGTFDTFFHVSHFAPKSLKGGYRLLKQLGNDSEISTILTITEDLIETLKKLENWKYSTIPLPSTGNYLETKYIAWNNPKAVETGFESIVDYCESMYYNLPRKVIESYLLSMLDISPKRDGGFRS